MMCASPASHACARAEPARCTSRGHDASTSPGVRDTELAHSHHRLRGRWRSLSDAQAGAGARHASRLGTSRNERSTPRPRRRGRSRARARCRSPRRRSRAPSPRSRRACRWPTRAAPARARGRSSSRARRCRRSRGCCRSRRARSRPTSVSASTPSRLQSVAASAGGKSSSTTRVDVAEDRQDDRRSRASSGRPAASTASASGSASAAGTETSIGRPSICESAVAAVPEPMLASSRSASSCWSEYVVFTGASLRGCRDGSDVSGRRGADRVAVDDEGDLAVREHGAARGAAAAGELGGQRARRRARAGRRARSTASAIRASAPRTITAWFAACERPWPSAAARSTIGRTPSRRTSIGLPATERTGWSSSLSVRSTRSSWIANGTPATRPRARTRSRASAADGSAPSCPRRAWSGGAPRRRARGSSCGRRPCRRRGPRRRSSPRRSRSRARRAARARAACRSRRPASAGIRPRSAALRATRAGSTPWPSSLTVIRTLPPAWRRGDLERAGRILAGGLALLGRLEPVVERVADEVDERVAERVDDRAVELGVLAGELEVDLLAEPRREVADEPREAEEHRLDRDHPHLHHHRLRAPARCARGPASPAGGPGTPAWATSDSACVRWTTSSPIRCISWSSRSESTRTVLVAGERCRAAGLAASAAAARSASAAAVRGSSTVALATSGTRGGGGLDDRGLVVGREPDLDRAAVELVDGALGRLGGDDLAVVGERGERHVGAHRRHQRVVAEPDDDVEDGTALDDDRQDLRLERLDGRVLLGRLADERVQPRDQRLLVEPLHAVDVDRLEGLAQRVEALGAGRRSPRARGRRGAAGAARRRPPSRA